MNAINSGRSVTLPILPASPMFSELIWLRNIAASDVTPGPRQPDVSLTGPFPINRKLQRERECLI